MSDEEVVDNEIEFKTGDTLGKALALVNQVRWYIFIVFRV
jgi:hypothetical protein